MLLPPDAHDDAAATFAHDYAAATYDMSLPVSILLATALRMNSLACLFDRIDSFTKPSHARLMMALYEGETMAEHATTCR